MRADPFASIRALAAPERLSPAVSRRKAEAIVARVRVFATFFSVLTVGWIALDALALEGAPLAVLSVERIVAGTLFALLAVACRTPSPTPGQAFHRLAVMFIVPGVFFLASHAVLPRSLPGGWAQAIASAYSFIPFVLAAGIGAFPLSLAETALIAAFLFVIEAVALGAIAPGSVGPEMLWLLFLIASAAAFAAASQLRLLEALVEQAIRDPLTGCLRREGGAELLDMQFLLAVRENTPLTVLFADIDRFKSVNDAFGHEAGDHVLAEVARSLAAIARESDVMIRWGGEEFVVVLPHTNSTDAVTLIRRLRAQGLGTLPDGRPVTVSIGVAEYRADAVDSTQELVALADRRMYLAKEAGRNRYVLDATGEAYSIVAFLPEAAAGRAAGSDSTVSRETAVERGATRHPSSPDASSR